MKPLLLSATTATTCLGVGLDAHRAALRENRSGLQPCAFETVDLPTWVGEVAGVDDHPLPAPLAAFDCRNNRLALLALRADGFEERVRAAIARHGAGRVGVGAGLEGLPARPPPSPWHHHRPPTHPTGHRVQWAHRRRSRGGHQKTKRLDFPQIFLK